MSENARIENPSQQALQTEVEALEGEAHSFENRLIRLEDEVEKQKDSLISRIERAGIVIGVLGAALSIATGFFALPKAYKEFRGKPETKMVSGWPLELSYDPTMKKVSFMFAAEVGNDGSKNDIVKQVRASFRPDSVPVDRATFVTTGIKLTEKGIEVRAPFDVSTASPRELICTMTKDLEDNDVQSVLQPGLNHLDVSLVGDDDKGRASASYCIWILNKQISDMVAATSSKTFIFDAQYQKCKEEQ